MAKLAAAAHVWTFIEDRSNKGDGDGSLKLSISESEYDPVRFRQVGQRMT